MNLYFIFPIMSVYFISMFYPVKDTKQVSFQPPRYIFAIMWPILLLLLGYSWTLRTDISYLYFILTLLLCSWLILFSFSKKWAFYELLFTLLFTILIYRYRYDTVSSNLLVPLILWLSFACILNFNSISS
jgi:benzodiazapine receptor